MAAEGLDRGVLLHRGPAAGFEPADIGTDAGFALFLETSGTTGTPKRVRHRLDRLLGRIPANPAPDAVWLLSYDPCGFAGLQVILTALRGGGTLVAAPGADLGTLADLAVRHGVTHASGTPSFWRGLLLTGAAPPLRAITLGGEAADQPLLDALTRRFPGARLRHIYASTEAGALFAVSDGREGFPARWLDTGVDGVDLRIRDGVLDVRSPRSGHVLSASGGEADPIRRNADTDGWLSTGDLVEIRDGRVLFRGRNDLVVNVAGTKVIPEEVERHLLAVPGVQDAAVTAIDSPITGKLLLAMVAAPEMEETAIRALLREALSHLPAAARPRRIQLVDRIDLLPSGKKRRQVRAQQEIGT